MSRQVMYPEGSDHLNLIVPIPVKAGLRTVAGRQRQSMSQIVSVVLEDWLRRRGELPQPEEVTA